MIEIFDFIFWTAAHCIQYKGDKSPTLPRDIIVLLGVYDLNNPYEAGRFNFPIQNIKIHPDWNPNADSYNADIAVLVLEHEIIFWSSVQPICLPDSKIVAITKGYVVGYGVSEDETKVHENIPKVIETPIQKNEDCFVKDKSLAKLSSNQTFCGGTGTGVGVCKGDSGSGLVVNYTGTYYLRGIVSSGLKGGKYVCDVDTYSIFTDVTKYIDWINSISTSQLNWLYEGTNYY